jgi:hypothetical protein
MIESNLLLYKKHRKSLFSSKITIDNKKKLRTKND